MDIMRSLQKSLFALTLIACISSQAYAYTYTQYYGVYQRYTPSSNFVALK